MSDTKLQSVIGTVIKLLALAANNTNLQESAAATSAANKLMGEYRIAQADLEAAGTIVAEPFVKVCVAQGGRRTAFREVLLAALCDHYGTCFYLSSYRSGGQYGTKGRAGSKGVQSYTCVGKKSDVEIVQYMYTWIVEETQRLCRWYTGGKGVKAAGAWLVGFASGVSAQLSEARAVARKAAQEEHSSAMVILDKRGPEARTYMQKEVGTKTASSISGASDSQSRWEGYQEGKKLKLKDGIGQGTTPKANALTP